MDAWWNELTKSIERCKGLQKAILYVRGTDHGADPHDGGCSQIASKGGHDINWRTSKLLSFYNFSD